MPLLNTKQARKYPHLLHRKGWDTFAGINPIFSIVSWKQVETLNSQLWTSSTQTFKTLTWGTGSQKHWFWKPMTFILETYKVVINKETFLMGSLWLIPPGLRVEWASKEITSQPFPEKAVKAAREGEASDLAHPWGLTAMLSGDQGSQQTPPQPSWIHCEPPISSCKELVPNSCHPSSADATPGRPGCDSQW